MASFAEAAAAMNAAGNHPFPASAVPTPAPQTSPPPTTPMQGVHPSGQTPNAKRPRAREGGTAIQSPPVAMSLDAVSAGFHALFAQVQTGAQYADDMGESVTYNSTLLNALISRVNALEAAALFQTQKIDGEIMPKLTEVASGVESRPDIEGFD